MAKTITADNRSIAKILATSFGVRPNVKAYWDERETLSIDILSCVNPVDNQIVDYGSIGMSDHPLYDGGAELKTRVELIATVNSKYDVMPNIVATAAFTIVKETKICYPGMVIDDIVALYLQNNHLKHLYMTVPGLWDANFETVQLDTKKVSWLQVIPISESERVYMQKNGEGSLDDLFEEKQIDISNLDRESAV